MYIRKSEAKKIVRYANKHMRPKIRTGSLPKINRSMGEGILENFTFSSSPLLWPLYVAGSVIKS